MVLEDVSVPRNTLHGTMSLDPGYSKIEHINHQNPAGKGAPWLPILQKALSTGLLCLPKYPSQVNPFLRGKFSFLKWFCSSKALFDSYLPNIPRTIHWSMQAMDLNGFIMVALFLQSTQHSRTDFFHTDSNYIKSNHMWVFLLAPCWSQLHSFPIEGSIPRGPKFRINPLKTNCII